MDGVGLYIVCFNFVFILYKLFEFWRSEGGEGRCRGLYRDLGVMLGYVLKFGVLNVGNFIEVFMLVCGGGKVGFGDLVVL